MSVTGPPGLEKIDPSMSIYREGIDSNGSNTNMAGFAKFWLSY